MQPCVCFCDSDRLTGGPATSHSCLSLNFLDLCYFIFCLDPALCLSAVTCGREDLKNSVCDWLRKAAWFILIIEWSPCRAHSAGSPARFQVSTAATRMVAADSTSPEASSVLHCLLPCQAPQFSAHLGSSCKLQNPLQAKEAGSVLIMACKLASNQGKPTREGRSPHQGISSVRVCPC